MLLISPLCSRVSVTNLTPYVCRLVVAGFWIRVATWIVAPVLVGSNPIAHAFFDALPHLPAGQTVFYK
jgi:uncharacterized membrane protein YphA (DoxX/SURF4 family)